MKKLIKVDRVSSVREAAVLEELGVDIIGLSLKDNPKFNDSRNISVELLREIYKGLRKTRICCELESENQILNIGHGTPLLIQCSGLEKISTNLVESLNIRSKSFVRGDFQISYDDDPEWLTNLLKLHSTELDYFYQIDLLPDVQNSWLFLKTECPNYDEELQIKDINEIALNFPVMISVDFNLENVLDVIESLPAIQGLFFTLGDEVIRDDFHWIRFPELLEILDALQHLQK
jgi:hypothetical protein